MSDPEITIGIMTYDRIEMLKEAVHSVLNQTFNNFKLIIANDFTKEMIDFESLGIEKDSRIKIINHSQNKGEVKNMNFLLHYTNSEWFTWLADDDLMHPDYLHTLYESVSKCDEVVAAYCNYADGPSPKGKYPVELELQPNNVYESKEFIVKYTSKKCNLIGCYGLMKTDVLKTIGGIQLLGNSFGPYSDTLIPILLAEHGKISWINLPLVFLRTHPESPSFESTDFSAFISAEADFLNQLEKVCSTNNLNVIKDISISNMMSWFSKNELCVLSRDSSLSFYMKCVKYFTQQFKVNKNKVPDKYKIKYYLMISKHLTRYIYNNLIRQFYYPLINSLRTESD